MLIIVLILNLLIAGLCWYGVWRIWRWRQALIRVTAALTLAEQETICVLSEAVYVMQQGQTGTAQIRQHYQQIVLRLQQVQQVMALLGLGQLAWRRYQRRSGKDWQPFILAAPARSALAKPAPMQPSLMQQSH